MPRQTAVVNNFHEHGWLPDPNATATPLAAAQVLQNFRMNSAGYMETARGYLDILTSTDRNIQSLNSPVFPHFGGTVAEPEMFYININNEFYRLTNDADDDLVSAQLTDGLGIAYSSEHIRRWSSFDLFGEPVFNNPSYGALTVGTGGAVSVIRLPNFNDGMTTPTHYTATHLGTFGAQLVAVGFNGNARRIAFSDVSVTVGDYPTWDFTDDDTFANEVDISSYSDGEPLFGQEYNGSYYIFTTTNILRVDFDPSGDHSITVAVGDNGALTSWSVASIPNGFFVVGNRECFFFDGSSKTVLGRGKWQETFFNSLDLIGENTSQVAQAEYDGQGNVWVKYQVAEDVTEVLVVNVHLNDVATVLTDYDEVEYIRFSERGVPFKPLTYDTQPDDEFDMQPDIPYEDLGSIISGRFEQRILSVGDNTMFAHDLGTTNNGRVINAFYRRSYINDKATAYGRVTIHEVVPFVEGSEGDVLAIRMIGADTNSGDIYSDEQVNFDVVNDAKADFRWTTRYPGIEFSTTDHVTLYGYEVTLSTLSRR